MKRIAHRRNSRADLAATPRAFGVEIDVRSRGDRLILHHDPYAPGEAFDAWLDDYRHGTLIVNVKEEGLEARVLERLAAHGVDDFFFLDQSFPFLLRTAARGESRCAVRVSEYERVETALALAGKVRWVWVDCFTRFPLAAADVHRLRDAGFALCLVSPELQGRYDEAEILDIRRRFLDFGVEPDAVCTKLEMADAWVREL